MGFNIGKLLDDVATPESMAEELFKLFEDLIAGGYVKPGTDMHTRLAMTLGLAADMLGSKKKDG